MDKNKWNKHEKAANKPPQELSGVNENIIGKAHTQHSGTILLTQHGYRAKQNAHTQLERWRKGRREIIKTKREKD